MKGERARWSQERLNGRGGRGEIVKEGNGMGTVMRIVHGLQPTQAACMSRNDAPLEEYRAIRRGDVSNVGLRR